MDPIYLDYAATTPVRPEVREAMEPYLDRLFANPSSSHRWGRQARSALEDARASVAAALGVRRREVYFVRGGTESDNLAVLGRVEAARAEGMERPEAVTLATEHKAVLDAVRSLETWGGRATVLPVTSEGLPDPEALQRALDHDPAPSILSVMWVNNETGVVQDIPALVEAAHARGVVFHTDAVQAVGKVPVRLDDVPVDLLSLTGHKIHGPKSTGVLIARDGVALAPRIHGGAQEGALRPGTQDVAGAVGVARALALAIEEQEAFAADVARLRDRLQQGLEATIPGLAVHGGAAPRAPHVLNVGIPSVDAELLQVGLDLEGLAVSAGSACQSGSRSASHVLEAMLGSGVEGGVVRYSLDRATTEGEVDEAVRRTVAVVERLRQTSPAGSGGPR